MALFLAKYLGDQRLVCLFAMIKACAFRWLHISILL